MKKLTALSLCAVMALSLSVAAFAAERPMLVSPAPEDAPMVIAPAPEADAFQPGYALHIDGEDTGVRACVMVPLRAVAEKLGFAVVWNGDGSIFLDNDKMHSTITLGEDLYQVTTSVEGMVGMSAPFSLGMAPYAVDGTTYVPLGLFDALLGSRQGAVTMQGNAICLDTDPLSKDEAVQIPSPLADYETLAEAAKAVGFELTVPDALNGSDHYDVSTIANETLQVIYRKGENETARVRKAAGTEDISGDYNVYAQVETATADGIQITLKGNAGKISLATWTDKGYTYAISVEGGIPVGEMTQLVSSVH